MTNAKILLLKEHRGQRLSERFNHPRLVTANCAGVKRLVAWLMLLVLHGCAQHQTLDPSALHTQQASSLEYVVKQAALQTDEVSKTTWQLTAAAALIEQHQPAMAEKQLQGTAAHTQSQQQYYTLLQGKALAQNHRPNEAIRTLNQMGTPSMLPLDWQRDYHQLLATLYCQKGALSSCFQQSVNLDALPLSPQQHLQQRLWLWQTLLTTTDERISEITTQDSPTLEGWLALRHEVTKTVEVSPAAMLASMTDWRRQHPEHPANQLLTVTPAATTQPIKQVALLLPISGPFSGPGGALRDGFVQAYLQDSHKDMTFKLYDTHQQAVTTLYQQASQQGANLVLGPLLKTDVDVLSQHHLKQPVIMLNEGNHNRGTSANLFLFTLNPQQEAQQLAIKIFQAGLRHPLIIQESTERQQRLSENFKQSWQSINHTIPLTMTIDDDHTLDQTIQHLLEIEQSKRRAKRLKQTIQQKLVFYPRRRQDIDAIVIFSDAAKAKQIKPMLNFYFAGNLPTYATSQVYSGWVDPQSDSDLNQIIFDDLPWLLQRREQLKHEQWPEALNNYNRLFAMGRAAYRISKYFDFLQHYPTLGIPADPGQISFGQRQHFYLSAQWAQFQQGVASPSIG